MTGWACGPARGSGHYNPLLFSSREEANYSPPNIESRTYMGMKTGSRKPARAVALGVLISDALGTCTVWVGHIRILYLVLFLNGTLRRT